MDFTIMATSFPKLLSAAVITLKLLSLSLFFGLFIGLLFAILRLNKNPIINKFAYGYSYSFLKLQKINLETFRLSKKQKEVLM